MAVNMLFLKFCQTQLMKLEKAMVEIHITRFADNSLQIEDFGINIS